MIELSIVVVWAVTLCSFIGCYQRFGGMYSPSSPVTTYKITGRHNTEDRN